MSVAFFDVDETLITVKSMFAFLRHWLAERGDDGGEYARITDEIKQLAAAGTPREEINRHYTGSIAESSTPRSRNRGSAGSTPSPQTARPSISTLWKPCAHIVIQVCARFCSPDRSRRRSPRWPPRRPHLLAAATAAWRKLRDRVGDANGIALSDDRKVVSAW